MAKIEDRDRPWVSNYPVLREWLDRRNAVCMWQNSDAEQSVEGWAIGAAAFIVVVYARHHGWDIFTSTSSNDVDVTLADAEKRLGLA